MNLLTKLLKDYQIILATQSPRRINLLKSLGLEFEIIPANIDESNLKEVEPSAYCKKLAYSKAHNVRINYSLKTNSRNINSERTNSGNINSEKTNSGNINSGKNEQNFCLIIAADTIVVLDGEIINKPQNENDAFNILKKLSGNTHLVYTGIAVLNLANSKEIIDYSSTVVYFRELSDSEILDYISTGSPMDKAGGYGIQDDYGALFIRRIEGCYNNVIGLPLEHLFQILIKVIN